MKRTLLVALVLGSVAPATLVLSRSAEAAACSGSSGVTVVVQFPTRTEIGCASGDPSSGVEALERAGFTITRVAKFPGAVCRIDGVPTAEQDACVNMPPANAYWTYFHAKPGGTWTSSNVGADGYDPKPGSVEGWRYGDGDEPDTAPPGSPTTPTPSTTPKPTPVATQQPSTPKPAPSGTSGAVVAAPAASAAGTPTGTATAGPSASGSPTGTPTGTPSATAAPSAADVAESSGPLAAETPAPAATANGGASWIWGVALLAVLVAVGGTVAYRRRT